MGAINLVAFGGILVDLVIISMIISNAFWGYKKGLTAVIFSLLVSIISLILVFILYKPVANLIMEKTQLDEILTSALEDNLSGLEITENVRVDVQNPLIPDNITDSINSSVNGTIQETGSNAIAHISKQLAHLMIKVGTVMLLYGIIRFFLLFIRFAAELIANLPIVKLFNKSGGLVYGILKGFVMIYVILAIFFLLSPFVSQLGVIAAVEDSFLGSKMYNNNIILNLFK